jgi:hypothetical protein
LILFSGAIEKEAEMVEKGYNLRIEIEYWN